MKYFNKIHETKEGERMQIVSMSATHLVNMLNLILRKQPALALEKVRTELTANFAPDNLSDKQAAVMGFRKPSQKEKDQIEAELEVIKTQLLESAFNYALPYILVGVCRNDTRDGVIAILQDVTDINDQIYIPVPNAEMPLLLDEGDPYDLEPEIVDLIEEFGLGDDWRQHDDDRDDLPF